MKKSLSKRILFFISTFIVALSLLSIFMSYRNFLAVTEETTYSAAHTVAETCGLILDVEKIDNYMKTGKRDSAYYEMWNKLLDYRNTNKDIVKLSVVKFEEDGCHYVFDTNLTKRGAFLGDVSAYDAYQSERKEQLVEGADIGHIAYADQIVAYRPLYSSYNIPIGYVQVGISTVDAEKNQFQYLVRLSITMFALAVLLALLFIFQIRHSVIQPIHALTTAASSYEGVLTLTKEDSPLHKLDIKTGDEIETLFHSLKKMESDILSSANSLAVATWNSNHDSMTQLYNKRYLEECRDYYSGRQALGVVYFDVDNLKKMNDICGHENGDEVIVKTAAFVRKYVPEGGAGFRMGGDEFMMFIPDVDRASMAEMVAGMKNDPETTLTPPEKEVQCRIAIGYSYSDRVTDLDSLVKEADSEMYKDKKSHR